MRIRVVAAAAVVAVAASGLVTTAPVVAAPVAVVACPPSPFDAELDATLRARYPGRRFSAAVVDLRDGCEYHLHPGQRMTTASVFKVEVMAAVLLRAQREGRGLTAWEAARVRPMIAESANAPTSELFLALGGAAGFAGWHQTFGLGETSTPSGTWGLTSSTARDQVHLLRQVLLGGGPLEAASRQRALVEMLGVVPSQRWGITEGVPAGWPVALKNGFAGSSCCGWRLNSVGLVGSAWLVATFTDGWPSEVAGIEGNRFLNRVISTRLARVPVPPFATAEAFVTRQLRDLAGMPPMAHVAEWTAAIHQGTDPIAAVALLLAVGRYAHHDGVARLYLAGLGRAPDPGGWEHWAGLVRSGQRSLGGVADAIAGSVEAGAGTDEAFVDRLYQRALGRPPDSTGRAHWLAALRSGRLDRGDVLAGIAGSPEHVARISVHVDTLVLTRALLGRTPLAGERLAGGDRPARIRTVLATDAYRARTVGGV